MADTKMIPINSDFNMENMVSKLTQMYQSKGFDVVTTKIGSGVSIKLSKDDDGIKKFVGLALGVTANITINDNSLIINFTDAEWVGKIIGICVGWFVCLIPAIIAVYGVVKQSEFPKTVTNDIQMLINSETK